MWSQLLDNMQGISAAWVSAVSISSVKGALLVVMAAALTRMVRPLSAARRHLLWVVVVTGLVALPVLSPLVPAWDVGPALPASLTARLEQAIPLRRQATALAGAEARGTAAVSAAAATSFVSATAERTAAAVPTARSRSSATAALVPSATTAAPMPSVRPVSGSRAVGARSAAPEHSPASPPLWVFVLGLWIAGVVAGLLPYAIGRVRLHAILGRSRPVPDPTCRRLLAEAALRIGLDRPVDLRTSGEMSVPVTWSTLRPVLLLPDAAHHWTRERLQHVFLHELAHVKRWDDATGALAQLACALHWFNPLVWWAASRMRVERERACDDRVLGAGCLPSAYAQDLLDVARFPGASRALALASVPMARRSGLESRVAAILDPIRGRGGPSVVTVMVAFALLGALVVPLAGLGPRSATPSADVSVVDPVGSAADEIGLGNEAVRALLPTIAVTSAAIRAEPLPLRRATLPPDLAAISGSGFGPGEVALAALPMLANQDRTQLCSSDAGGSRSVSSSSDNDREYRLEARWSSDDCRVAVAIEGDIEFTDGEDAILRMGPGSSLSIEERRDGHERELDAEPGPGGEPLYDYRVDGDSRPFDAEGRAWLGTLIPQLFRETGVDAGARVRRLLERGGVDAVFAEIDRIESDYVTRVYLSYLVEHGDLSTGQFDQVVAVAGDRMDSDYELAELLIHVARTEGLSEPIRAAYLAATETLDSDYEHRRVLSVLLDQPDLATSLVDDVIGSATRIGSDYERAELLIQAGRMGTLSGPGRAAYLDALRGLDSDYETRRVLDTFLDNGRLTSEELAEVLELSEDIGSDYERAELLIRVARENELSAEAASAFLRATAALDSDYEMRRTLGSVLGRAELRDGDVGLVLDLAMEIGSDYERAELLIQVAQAHRLAGELRWAYIDAAEDIGSAYERDRALAALVRHSEAR